MREASRGTHVVQHVRARVLLGGAEEVEPAADEAPERDERAAAERADAPEAREEERPRAHGEQRRDARGTRGEDGERLAPERRVALDVREVLRLDRGEDQRAADAHRRERDRVEVPARPCVHAKRNGGRVSERARRAVQHPGGIRTHP